MRGQGSSQIVEIQGNKGKSDWLGSKDSNLDCMIQSHESCRWTTSQQSPRYDIEKPRGFQEKTRRGGGGSRYQADLSDVETRPLLSW
jgi:hypothetical protein